MAGESRNKAIKLKLKMSLATITHTKIDQKDVYYRPCIWHIDLIHKTNTRGQLP